MYVIRRAVANGNPPTHLVRFVRIEGVVEDEGTGVDDFRQVHLGRVCVGEGEGWRGVLYNGSGQPGEMPTHRPRCQTPLPHTTHSHPSPHTTHSHLAEVIIVAVEKPDEGIEPTGRGQEPRRVVAQMPLRGRTVVGGGYGRFRTRVVGRMQCAWAQGVISSPGRWRGCEGGLVSLDMCRGNGDCRRASAHLADGVRRVPLGFQHLRDGLARAGQGGGCGG